MSIFDSRAERTRGRIREFSLISSVTGGDDPDEGLPGFILLETGVDKLLMETASRILQEG